MHNEFVKYFFTFSENVIMFVKDLVFIEFTKSPNTEFM